MLKRDFDETNFVIDNTPVNVTVAENRFTNLDINFEGLIVPNVNFDLWFLKFDSISDVFFLLDFSFRIYFALRLCFKYWDAGVVRLPEIDMRSEKGIKNPFKISCGRMVILFVTSPLIGALSATLVGTWMVKTMSSVYYPLYREYASGCVLSDGNGTFVTENLYSMGYNSAYEKGSTSLLEGVESFDLKRSQTCTSSHAKTQTRHNTVATEIASYKKAINTTGDQMYLLQKCINAPVIDDDFQKACCGQLGYEDCNVTVKSDLACPMNEMEVPSIPHLTPGKRSFRLPL